MESQLASLHFALSDDSAEGVSIRNIEITAPYKGRFVVAAADEKEMGITFDTDTKDFSKPFEGGAKFYLPATRSYDVTITLADGRTFSSVLTGNFENGQSYTVEVKGIESDNIKFEVK
jgi:hypothetical protein